MARTNSTPDSGFFMQQGKGNGKLMNTSSVVRVNNDSFCILRKSYLELCGDKGAALLLNLFIY